MSATSLTVSMAKIDYKRRLLLSAGIYAATFGALADTYPLQSIKLVVPYGAGSATDLLARRIAIPLATSMGQAVIVENRAGANATIGPAFVAKAPADGYTLLFGNTQTNAVNPNLVENPPYDATKDFTAVARLFSTATILVVSASLPVQNVEELLAWLRANPKRANFGSTAFGTVSHLPSAYLSKTLGIPMTHVPYNNTGQLMTDLVRGEITMLFYPPDGVKAFIESGSLKPLAWSGAKRSNHFAKVATMTELGFKNFVFEAWYAMFAPKGTPSLVVNKLSDALAKILNEPKFAQDFANSSSTLFFAPSSEAEIYVKQEQDRFKQIAQLIDKN